MYHLQQKIHQFLSGILALLIVSLTAQPVNAQNYTSTKGDTLTKTVVIHPVIKGGQTLTSEHEYKSGLGLGDQLARDFSVGKITDNGIVRRFKTEGTTNEDWYSWRQEVMPPFNATIQRVGHPEYANKPGVMDREAPTGYILFKRDDGTTVVYAHTREIEVEKGDRVKAGEVVAKVGNNGTSRSPHIHVGAWNGETPYQIQVDLYADRRKK